MLRTLSALEGVNVLTKEDQKKIKGRGPCGVKIDGQWYEVGDGDGDGATKDDAQALLGAGVIFEDGSSGTVTNWCCDSCSWNQ
jgi:hypothetical protein